MAKKRKQKPSQSGRIARPGRLVLAAMAIALLALGAYLLYLNQLINLRFDGDTWALPSRVYARPLELYSGLELSSEELVYELNLANYQSSVSAFKPGQYHDFGRSIDLYARAFDFSGDLQDARHVQVFFSNGRISSLMDLVTNQRVELLRLPPVAIGSYYPNNGEDRALLGADDVPQELIEILLAVEDKTFYQHYGINPKSIVRALIANIKAGETVQGGSTLTQQLAKNLFLTPEKSLLRKINEAFMALLLELRFSKQAIILAYLNEVYLLQQNNISIHGFALGSRMLFKQPLDQLSSDKLALLVGMVKGPSFYNPLTHPGNARKRRNLVLRVMRDHKLIDEESYQKFTRLPLDTVKGFPGVNPFPAYLDLVKRQLNSNYSASELSARGLRIFTAFDPLIQRELERGLQKGLARFDQPELQTAVVIADYLNGDIQALIGDRVVDYPGFNRAVLAQRPIGSLIKPLLLYSLLESGLSLASPATDQEIQIKQSNGDIWQPSNYDRKLHGEMTLYQAFVHSYNLPFVHFGVNGALEFLANNLDRIALLKHEVVYPSLLLGTTAMSAFEVAQMFQVIASNGYFTPLTTIRQVNDQQNITLSRIPLNSHKLFNQTLMIQVQRAMVGVAEEGTARYLAQRFPELTLAGKTGTTNDARDSWFSGFSDRLLTVVWLGRDDNGPINLTGSSGALRVWADIMQGQKINAFKLTRDDSLEWRYINRFNGRLSQQSCADSVLLPFVPEQTPVKRSTCK